VNFKKLRENKRKREFFFQNAVKVAKNILGDYLVVDNGGLMIGKIVEVEAYLGVNDDASHSFRGRITKRNKVLFEDGGVVYVYSIYGKYFCFNIVVSRKGDPQAVFVRALEPILGIEIMLKHRKVERIKMLTNGPCRWTTAFGIDKKFLGRSTVSKSLYISQTPSKNFKIVSAKRIGIEYANNSRDLPLRFYIKDNSFVSKK